MRHLPAPRIALAIACLAVVAALAGCGNKGPLVPPPPPPHGQPATVTAPMPVIH